MPSLKQGQPLTKNDLNVYFYVGGSLSDPYWVTFTLYDCTSGSDEVIGLPDRIPIKFNAGSYFAQWTVPDDEPVGLHKIRWKYKDSSSSSLKEDVEEFQIIPLCAGVDLVYPPEIMYLIQHLRNKLRDINPDRDYSVAGEEEITVVADGEEITLSIQELYEIVYGKNKKEKIKDCFIRNQLYIKSSNKDCKIELKKISDVLKHYCLHKKVFKTQLLNKSITTTEDHSIYTIFDSKLLEVKPNENPKSIVIIDQDSCVLSDVIEIKKEYSREFMYDLSVEDNQNFFLTSGILAHNSFAQPSKEGTIAGFTRTRGYRWTDDSLYMHLVQACNYLNLIPPDTSFNLMEVPAPWQPLLLLQAMAYALYDLAILWINEEFSYNLNGFSLDISRSDKYMNVASTLQSQTDTQMTEAKRRLHYTIGLRQSRYTMTYGGFFGPHTSGRMSVKKWVLGFGTQSGKGF